MNESPDRPCALVTGATSGIGAAFANRLAQEGFDLILHGRRQEKLMGHAKILEKTHPISVAIVIAELSRRDDIKMVEERIEGLDRLDMLVNNAGYWEPGFFWDVSVHCPDGYGHPCPGTGARIDRDRVSLTTGRGHFTKEQRTWLQPEDVVEESLRALEKGVGVCIPGLKRRLLVKLASFLPRSVYYKTMKTIGERVKRRWDEIEDRSMKRAVSQ